MRYDELSPTTKQGKRLTFEWIEDLENDGNRGFILHELSANMDGACVGYIKVSYIPKERFRRYYPSIFNYLAQIAGWCGLFRNLDERHCRYEDLDDADLRRLISGVAHRLHRHVDVNVDRAELLRLAAEMEKTCWELRGKQFRQFIKFQVDRPHVAYVEVKGGWSEPVSHRRQGIGTALYLEMARRLAERGLRMYASSLQSPEAQAIWNYFESKGWVQYDKKAGRKYLSLTGK